MTGINRGRHGPRAPRGQTATAAALARSEFDIVLVDERSDTVCKRANACAFKCHQRADVPVFVLGQGWRDNGADGIVVVGGDGGIHGDIHHGRRGAGNNDDSAANDANSGADDILC